MWETCTVEIAMNSPAIETQWGHPHFWRTAQPFCGTELNITQEGVPAAISAEACYLGWQESLTLLAKLVEAEIPDQP